MEEVGQWQISCLVNAAQIPVACRDSLTWAPESELQHKVSVVFSFPEEAGQLFNALSAFALREINLTKIESRPFKDDPIKLSQGMGRRFQYRFYIDFIGHLGSDKVQNAVVHLQVAHLYLRLCHQGLDTPRVAV